MPLNLYQMHPMAIVDRVVEWGEDGKERPLNPIMRGIIVKVNGDAVQESVGGVVVCFGPEEREEVKRLSKTLKPVDVTVNQVTVKGFLVKPAELNEVHDWESRPAREAWARLFRFPTNVGKVFEPRQGKGSRRRQTVDTLQLTPKAQEGPVKDEVSLDLPEQEA